jgi:hypothetical protein
VVIIGQRGCIVCLYGVFPFLQLQARLEIVLGGVGGLSHADWRTFKADHIVGPVGGNGFIDGDLIESFLDLPLAKMQQVLMLAAFFVALVNRSIHRWLLVSTMLRDRQ